MSYMSYMSCEVFASYRGYMSYISYKVCIRVISRNSYWRNHSWIYSNDVCNW